MEKTAGHRAASRRRGQKTALGEREKRRLLQLGVCLALFLTVFFTKGLDRLTVLREDLSRALRSNVNFEAAFADLGWSLASGKPLGKSLTGLWVDVFLPQEKESPSFWREGPLYQNAQQELRSGTEGAERFLTVGKGDTLQTGPEEADEELPEPRPTSPSETILPAVPESEPEPSAEPAVLYMEYTGPALPDNTTMDRYALGLSETMSPVDAALTSGFGWREHPISGGEKFHFGVDLAVGTGTEVKAFAAGTVDYIGESDIYGQYLQLDHGNGVTSFYAHCSKLCVQQGQVVAMGEKVAESGATGDVTGPHLHFELKKDGVCLNPVYYISLLA